MFGKKKQKEQEDSQEKLSTEDSLQLPQIHVMPPIFLSAAAQKIKLKKKKKIEKRQIKKQPQNKPVKKSLIHPSILILAALLLIGLSAVVVYLFIYKIEPDSDYNINSNINTPIQTNLNRNTNQANTNIQPPKLICGDGILSKEKGEECDDGNNISGDGCSAQCKIEKQPSFPQQITLFTSYPTTTDSDEDFLTDVEEKLYGTGVNNMDEDGDEYLDGLELINLYDPKEKTPSVLIDSDIINIFNNQEQGYSLFYPNGWQIRYLNDDKSEVYFESSTVEFVQVLVTDNSKRESIITWAKNQFPDIDTSKLERVGVGDKLGIKSPNGLTVNFSNEDKIYSVTYQISTLRKLNFKATFQMMYNSLKLYTRSGAVVLPPVQWSSYINNQLGLKLQYPINLEVVVNEDDSIKLDDFTLQFIKNIQGAEFDDWFWQTYNTEENRDCRLKNSELRIGKLRTFFVDKLIEEDTSKTEEKECKDGGYYAISRDKKQIIKLTIGKNPVREMAQILATIQLFEPESSMESPELLIETLEETEAKEQPMEPELGPMMDLELPMEEY